MADENNRENNNSTNDIMHKGLFGRAIGNGWWKFKFFSRIPQNYVLIKRNKFAKSKTKLIIEESNRFINPFLYDVKLVSKKERFADYKPRNFQAFGGAEVNMDNIVQYKIVDWNKFYTEVEDPEKIMNVVFESRLSALVRKYEWSLLEHQTFDLPKIRFKDGTWYRVTGRNAAGSEIGVPVKKIENPNSNSQKDFDNDLANFAIEIKEELADYGIELTKFRCKEIHTSKENEAQQERLNNAKREKEIAIAEGEKKLAEASYAARIRAAQAQAEVDAFNIEYNNLIAHGVTKEDALRYLLQVKYANNQNVTSTAQSAYGAMQGVTQAATADAINNARRYSRK